MRLWFDPSFKKLSSKSSLVRRVLEFNLKIELQLSSEIIIKIIIIFFIFFSLKVG